MHQLRTVHAVPCVPDRNYASTAYSRCSSVTYKNRIFSVLYIYITSLTKVIIKNSSFQYNNDPCLCQLLIIFYQGKILGFVVLIKQNTVTFKCMHSIQET